MDITQIGNIGLDCWKLIFDYKADLEVTQEVKLNKLMLNNEFKNRWNRRDLYLSGPGERFYFFEKQFQVAYFLGLGDAVIEYVEKVEYEFYIGHMMTQMSFRCLEKYEREKRLRKRRRKRKRKAVLSSTNENKQNGKRG